MLLSGDTLAARGADPSARNQAYQLLGVAQDILVASGLRGLALVIDEVESVYTKLPGYLSRLGAFRVLSSICVSSHLAHCSAAIAITPDAWRELKSFDVRAALYRSLLATEPLELWAEGINRRLIPILNCEPLTREQKTQLLSKVALIYVKAYPTFAWDGVLKSEWHHFAASTAQAQIPVRIAVRRAVDFLDLKRCTQA
jgi:hypothetical protein